MSDYVKIFIAVTFLVLMVMASLSSAQAPPVREVNKTYEWVAPATDEDGGPLTGLDGYILYWRLVGGTVWDSVNVGAVTVFTLQNINFPVDGDYEVNVSAYDSVPNESQRSNTIITTVDRVYPNPPQGFLVSGFNLTWEIPTLNEDGSPLIDLDSFTVHYGITNGAWYSESLVPPTQTSLSLDMTGKPSGTYNILMTSSDTSGNEGVSTATLTSVLLPDDVPPAPPTMFRGVAKALKELEFAIDSLYAEMHLKRPRPANP